MAASVLLLAVALRVAAEPVHPAFDGGEVAQQVGQAGVPGLGDEAGQTHPIVDTDQTRSEQLARHAVEAAAEFDDCTAAPITSFAVRLVRP